MRVVPHRIFRLVVLLGAAVAVQSASAAVTIDGLTIQDFDKSRYSQTPTACDKRAAFDVDRDRVTPPVRRDEVDLDAAIAACLADLQRDPDNPRLNYQIARIYGYKGDTAAGDKHRRLAAQAGYPMAIFAVAYTRAFGPEVGRDRCQGGRLMRQAAKAGSFAALVSYPAYLLNGSFAACADLTPNKAELSAFLAIAKTKAQGHIEELLLESLTRDVGRLP